MRYEIFINEVVNNIKNVFKEDEYIVTINKVYKNNGVKLDGLVIIKNDVNISPTIYLNTFYEDYKNGANLSSIVNKIIDIYYNSKNHEVASKFEVDYDYEKIKSKIIFKLINFDKNRELLRVTPFIKYMNLAMIFQCVIDISDCGIAAIRITNDHCKAWNITTKDLINIAMINTPSMFPGVIRNIKDVVKELVMSNPINVFSNNLDDLNVVREDSDCYYYASDAIDEDIIDKMLDKVTINNPFDMYVLSNSYGINGASTILYNGMLDSFARKLGSDLYILPSSVHEVILIPKLNDLSVDELNSMVCEINNTQVPTEDVLADCIYEYSRKKKAIMIVNK